jgi:L-threonylcarbamoyladenylate synthase
VGWLTFDTPGGDTPATVEVMLMPREASAYAARFYAALHELDRRGVEVIVVDLPPRTEEWLAVHDRLARAARK